MKKYLLILILIIISVGIRGQKVPYRRVEFKYPPVNTPKYVEDELFKYLGGYNLPLMVYNITNKKDIKYKEGVYEFFLISSHPYKRLFIDYKGRIKIFGTLVFDEFLDEYLKYIKSEKLPEGLKLKYLRIIIPYIEKQHMLDEAYFK